MTALTEKDKELVKKLDQIIHGLIETEGPVKACGDQGAVLVVGKTGTGKSTWINYIMGTDLEVYSHQDELDEVVKVRKKEADQPGPTIGHSANSQTMLPSVHPCGTEYVLCDTGGFGDTHPGARRTIVNVAVDLMLRRAEHIKELLSKLVFQLVIKRPSDL